MKKCVIYARLAAEDKLELKSQVDDLQALAKKKGYTVDKVYKEFGSGFQINPMLNKLLQKVEAEEIKIILCRDYTRMSRTFYDWQEIDQLLTEKGVEFITP